MSQKKDEKMNVVFVSEKLVRLKKAKEFFEYAGNTTICGKSSISAGIEICKKLGARKAVLTDYANSGDLTKDYGNCVTYASLVFE